jgi:tetratricopeptide (TPR) repeat protein
MNDIKKDEMEYKCDVLNNRACLLAKDGKYEESIKIFKEILADNPKYSSALENKTTVLEILDRYDEVLAIYEKRIVEGPPFFSISLINLLTYLGKYEQALEHRRKIPRQAPMGFMMLGMLSQNYKTLEKFASEGGTMEETIKKMEQYRSEVKRASDKSQQLWPLLWAPKHDDEI